VAAALLPVAASAGEFSGDLSLGLVRTAGNADTTSLNAKSAVDYRAAPWENLFTGAALRANQNHVVTDEKYSLGNKLSYNFNEADYAFFSANFDSDRFGAITKRYSAALGYGRRIINTPTQRFDLEIGAGANRIHNHGESDAQTNAILTLGGKYAWKITDTTQFSQTLRTEIAQNNTYINPITELKLTVVGNLYTTISYEIRYNTQVPEDTVHMDQITTVNLGYTFGKKPATPPA
jgi:putative salt-induced outer membrane protein